MNYEVQAQDFLSRYNISLTVKPTDSGKCPPFCDGKHIHGDDHRVTMTRALTQKRLTFPFWNSLNDSQEGRAPTAYDVLACCGSDLSCPDTFEEFCAEYGYDTDSRKALATFRRCSAFAAKLQNFFDTEEMRADLQSIQ